MVRIKIMLLLKKYIQTFICPFISESSNTFTSKKGVERFLAIVTCNVLSGYIIKQMCYYIQYYKLQIFTVSV